ncbi:hypothetical protein RRG08_052687 [Elysia crispata]|uniref:Uncharacterized protein n=1 Tax=Elysia crispata TaxID=231223 RepID=A0AAE1EA51_9GAST|nr:hypothetical protein RRG08_052687 [Elysia crispata]
MPLHESTCPNRHFLLRTALDYLGLPLIVANYPILPQTTLGIGVETRRRNSLIDLMFGERGEVKSANRAERDIRVARAATQWSADHEQYFRKLTDQLRDNVLRLF